MTRSNLALASPPKPGTKGVYQPLSAKGAATAPAVDFTVKRIEGNLCYCTYHWPAGDIDSVFIWSFKDGPNILHDWKGKPTND